VKMQHRDHRRRMSQLKLNVILSFNEHPHNPF
jgi:hypothetical protein